MLDLRVCVLGQVLPLQGTDVPAPLARDGFCSDHAFHLTEPAVAAVMRDDALLVRSLMSMLFCATSRAVGSWDAVTLSMWQRVAF